MSVNIFFHYFCHIILKTTQAYVFKVFFVFYAMSKIFAYTYWRHLLLTPYGISQITFVRVIYEERKDKYTSFCLNEYTTSIIRFFSSSFSTFYNKKLFDGHILMRLCFFWHLKTGLENFFRSIFCLSFIDIFIHLWCPSLKQ